MKHVQRYKPLLLVSKSLFSPGQHVMELECSTSVPSEVGCRHNLTSIPLYLRWVGLALFRPTPLLFPFVNRLGHDGNRPEILKYSVSVVPNVPGRNYRDSFTVLDFSTPTLHTECLGSQSLWKTKVMLGERIRLTAFLRRQFAR